MIATRENPGASLLMLLFQLNGKPLQRHQAGFLDEFVPPCDILSPRE
jgi:hypothetical protein